MSKSRFVESRRLLPLIVYSAVAFAVLLVADQVLVALGAPRGVRSLVVPAWIVLFPAGGWLVWRRGARDA